MPNDQTLQRLSLLSSFLLVALAVGFVLQAPWAIALWPWPEGRLSYIFIGSIITAIAAALLWIGAAREWGAIAAGALNVLVTAGGMAVFLVPWAAQGAQPGLWWPASATALVAAAALGLLVWSRRYSIRDSRRTPLWVRLSFGLFVAALVTSGSALIWKAPNIMPWPVTPNSSVLFGWIFVGDACYFLYGLIYPRWHNARAQLWSFLAYDLVLLPPLLAQLGTVRPERVLSLYVYLLVLIYSAAIAIYYLVLNKTTRPHTNPLSGAD